MPSNPEPHSAAIDVAGLTDAWRIVSALTHPDTRHIVDTAMQTLRVAVITRGIGISAATGLRQSVRKHVRQAWTDGVFVPLARSRDQADRDVLTAFPMTIDLTAHAEMAKLLEGVASRIPSEATGTRDHVNRALGYLRILPVILNALDELDALASGMKPRQAAPAAGKDPGRDQIAAARRLLRAALAKALPALVDELADAVHRKPLAATVGPAFRSAGAALREFPARGTRKSDRGGPQWRRRLHEALMQDVIDEAVCPVLNRILHRHHGLALEKAYYHPALNHGGELGLIAARGDVTVTLAAHFAIGTGRMDLAFTAAVAGAAPREIDLAKADALLDALAPPEFNTGAHRVMRRLFGTAGEPSFRMSASDNGDLVVHAGPNGTLHTEFVEALTRIADEESVSVRVAAGRDTTLASSLIENGFSWRQAQGHEVFSRDPVDAAEQSRTPYGR